jgi:hypothetical protein
MLSDVPWTSLACDKPTKEPSMPRVSRDSAAHVEDHGPVDDRHEDIDGYTVNFLSFRDDADVSPLLHGLPDDRCHCPHWGYVFSGKITYRFATHDETFETGDAFYIPAGHVPQVTAGTEVVQFSPAEELQEVTATILANLQKLQSA